MKKLHGGVRRRVIAVVLALFVLPCIFGGEKKASGRRKASAKLQKEFFDYVVIGDVDEVNRLIRAGVDVNIQDD